MTDISASSELSINTPIHKRTKSWVRHRKRRKNALQLDEATFHKRTASELALFRPTWDFEEAHGGPGPIVRLPYEYIRVLFVGWLKFCYLQIFLGVCIFSMNLATPFLFKMNDDNFLTFECAYHRSTYYIIFGSSIFIVLTGVLGIVLCSQGFPETLITSYMGSLLACLICTGGAILFCTISCYRPDNWRYVEILQKETYFRKDAFRSLWENNPYGQLKMYDANLWDAMQRKLKCCGKRDYYDWMRSPCQCIPESCCNKNHQNECKRTVNGVQFSSNDTAQENLLVSKLLWPEPCSKIMEDRFTQQKLLWVILPMCCFCVQFALWAANAFLAKKMVYYIVRVAGGRQQFDEFCGGLSLLKNYDTMCKGLQQDIETHGIILQNNPLLRQQAMESSDKHFLITNDEISNTVSLREIPGAPLRAPSFVRLSANIVSTQTQDRRRSVHTQTVLM